MVVVVVVVQTLVYDMNVSPLHANAHAPNSGGRSPGSQTPGDSVTRGALDNEELFVIEGSKTDPWRSTPENWRSAKNGAKCASLPHFRSRTPCR